MKEFDFSRNRLDFFFLEVPSLCGQTVAPPLLFLYLHVWCSYEEFILSVTRVLGTLHNPFPFCFSHLVFQVHVYRQFNDI